MLNNNIPMKEPFCSESEDFNLGCDIWANGLGDEINDWCRTRTSTQIADLRRGYDYMEDSFNEMLEKEIGSEDRESLYGSE